MNKQLLRDLVLNQLRGYLTELEAMTQLPPAGSDEAIADHENWMKQHDKICDTVDQAEWVALMSVPPDVEALLSAIEIRKDVLLHQLRMKEQISTTCQNASK